MRWGSAWSVERLRKGCQSRSGHEKGVIVQKRERYGDLLRVSRNEGRRRSGRGGEMVNGYPYRTVSSNRMIG